MNFQARRDYIQAYVDSMFGVRDLTPIAKLRLKMKYSEWDVRHQAAEDWERMFENEPTGRFELGGKVL